MVCHQQSTKLARATNTVPEPSKVEDETNNHLGQVEVGHVLIKIQYCTQLMAPRPSSLFSYYRILRLLLDSGASASRTDQDGTTSLRLAARHSDANLLDTS